MACIAQVYARELRHGFVDALEQVLGAVEHGSTPNTGPGPNTRLEMRCRLWTAESLHSVSIELKSQMYVLYDGKNTQYPCYNPYICATL